MVAVSASVILTLAFLRTQTTVLQMSRNGQRRDLALQAAQTGAAVALEQLHSPDWSGVSERPAGVVSSDADGTASYAVEYRPVESLNGEPLAEDAALHLRVASTGTWRSASNPDELVARSVEVVVRLEPRLPGRAIRPGDSSAADDLAPNPGDYDAIQRYALFAGGGSVSLSLDPGGRIEGNVWLGRHLQFYNAPDWRQSAQNVRENLLDSIGAYLVSGSTPSAFLHPHPLAGGITFLESPDSNVEADLGRLRTPWNETEVPLALPQFNVSSTAYQVYTGGFEYLVADVPSTLRNTTLGPTPENPLGAYYRSGSVRLEDDVTIQGTLFSTGRITIAGENVHVAAFNWRGEAGRPLVSNVEHWPRLPAVVASEIVVEPGARAAVEGAVVAFGSLSGAGGNFEYVDADEADVTGTATASPLRQPHSLVQLNSEADLGGINGDGQHAIWLQNGKSGAWFPIVGVDAARRELTVLGEAHESSVACRIRRLRRRYLDVRGPVSAQSVAINSVPAWMVPTREQWDELHSRWRDGETSVSFIDWLADPANFAGWPPPLSEYGLKLEPTFHLRHAGLQAYRWSPPLFTAYQGTGADAEFAGYRWKVISWRELP